MNLSSLSAGVRNNLAKAVDNQKFEIADGGRIYVPGEGLFIGGAFSHRVNGGAWAVDPNLWVNAGLLDLFKAYFNGTTSRQALYIAPYSNNVAPTGTLVGSQFVATQGEFTNYTEATRPLWDKGTIAALPATNAANAARFTIAAGGPYTIRGAALLTSSVKSDATGFMPVCAAFATARTGLVETDKIDIEYALTASSS